MTMNRPTNLDEGARLESEAHALVSRQRAHFESNATRPLVFRVEQLKKLKKLLLANEDALHRAIYEDFGSGGINEAVMQNSNSNLPFGGVGTSGMGRYHGEFSFECFSHLKGVIDKPTSMESNFKYYGYTDRKMRVLRKLL